MTQNVNAINIKWHELFKPIEGLKADSKNHLIVEREIIPIIFVPGIMGSRLKNGDDEKVWDPDAKFFMLKKYGMFYVSAEERMELLLGVSPNADPLSAMNNDSSHNEEFNKYKGADKRNWGGISWSSYGKFMEKLVEHTFTDPIKQCFEFPLHACGYNWTGSNYDSGKALAAYIDETINVYKKKGRMCEKVILITHSMGGLTARSACVLHGAESKVLGVLHGVQPATGSPAAYWRMKAGWERPKASGPNNSVSDWFKSPLKMFKYYAGGYAAAWVLGTDGEEVTSLLANMPGGLELLPTKDYVDNEGNKQWLRYTDGNSNEHALPKSDPYKEIYLAKDVFYRLVNPEWIGESVNSDLADLMDTDNWSIYESNLEYAKDFHDELGQSVHDESFQFYSTGLATADHIEFKCEEHSWGTKFKRMGTIIKESIPMKAVTTGGGAVAKMAFGMPAFTSSGLMVSGALTVVSSAYKDSEHSANRGGFRDYANSTGGLKAKKVALTQDDWDELEDGDMSEDVDSDQESETVWVYTLQYPDGSGDGTVPDSSSTALDVAVTGWDSDDECEEVDAFGQSTGVPDSESESTTVKISIEDEDSFTWGHEPIYQTGTGQKISFAAIENFCLLKIEEATG